MELICDFISGSANTLPSCAFWKAVGGDNNKCSIVVYGVSNLVAVVDESLHRIVCTLKGHTGRVTSVFGLSLSDGSFYIFSGSEDKSIKVWKNCPGAPGEASSERYLSEWVLMSQYSMLMKASVVNIHALTSISSTSSSSSEGQVNEEMIVLSAVDAGGAVTGWIITPSSQGPSSSSNSSNSSGGSIGDKINGVSDIREVVINQHSPTQMPRCIASISLDSDLFVFVGSVDSRIYIYLADISELKCSIVIDSDNGGNNSNNVSNSSYQNNRSFKLVGVLIGHEEWISSLAVTTAVNAPNTFLVASSSQDNKIRLWKFKQVNNEVAKSDVSSVRVQNIDVEDDDFEANIDAEETDVQLDREEIANEARLQFESRNGRTFYLVFLDALLIGHEDWVTSVSFFPQSDKVRLFSTSMDRNFIIWSPDEHTGVWSPSSRMGDIGGTLGGSVGGNLLGFVNGCIAPDGNSILGVGFGGSFHLWVCDNGSSRWQPKPFMSGHFGAVNDIKWEPGLGRYVMSVSSDQTCRLFAPIALQSDKVNASSDSWKEISRPLIHGYDLSCIVLSNPPSFLIYCAGDEKIIRVFDIPSVVVDGLRKLCALDIADVSGDGGRILKAYIPELGLSNKAADLMNNEEKRELEIRGVSGVDWTNSPLEGQLADNTIWPETKKMFGHNNDVTCMDISGDGLLIASASKARDAKSASIIIWSALGMMPLEELPGHESSVVRVKFSPNNLYLASGGKDRSLCVYRRGVDGNKFTACKCIKEAHKRIIWDCCWSPDSKFLITASRDGSCRLWSVNSSNANTTTDDQVDVVLTHCFTPFAGDSVTSLDLASIRGSLTLAVGSEQGRLSLWSIHDSGTSASALSEVSDQFSHGSTTKRIQWKPQCAAQEGSQESSDDFKFQLATCGEDHTIRVFTLKTL